MIVVGIMGGLGNQLFQYGFALSLQKKTQCKVYIDFSWFEEYQNTNSKVYREPDIKKIGRLVLPEISTSSFPLKPIARIKKILWNRSKEVKYRYFKNKILPILYDKEMGFDDTWFNLKQDAFVAGYFTDEKYIINIKPIITEIFQLYFENNINELLQFTNIERPLVSVHIRRGDYLQLCDKFPVCTLQYFQNAIQILEKKIKSPFYLIFTDDIKWFKENASDFNIGNRFIICSEQLKNSVLELTCMAYCDHNIISNSTFSWWGAWIRDIENKIVIAPKTWLTIPERKILNEEIVPKRWTRI